MRNAIILVDNLNIRMKPDGDIIGVVRKGQRFPILKSESLPVCDWLQIKVSGDLLGWVAEVNKRDLKRFVRVEETAENPLPNDTISWAIFAAIIAMVIALVYSCIPS